MKNDIDERINRMIKAAPRNVEDGDAASSFYWKPTKKKKPKLFKLDLEPKKPLDEE